MLLLHNFFGQVGISALLINDRSIHQFGVLEILPFLNVHGLYHIWCCSRANWVHRLINTAFTVKSMCLHSLLDRDHSSLWIDSLLVTTSSRCGWSNNTLARSQGGQPLRIIQQLILLRVVTIPSLSTTRRSRRCRCCHHLNVSLMMSSNASFLNHNSIWSFSRVQSPLKVIVVMLGGDLVSAPTTSILLGKSAALLM